jgi:hypothetical protein
MSVEGNVICRRKRGRREGQFWNSGRGGKTNELSAVNRSLPSSELSHRFTLDGLQEGGVGVASGVEVGRAAERRGAAGKETVSFLEDGRFVLMYTHYPTA